MDNYTIVLFKNKTKKKIIKKFKTPSRAKKYFDSLIEENKSIIFGVETENGSPCKYEIALLEKTSGSLLPYFIKDEFGRQVKIELNDPDHTIIKILPYKKEEFIYDIKSKERITINKFLSKYLPKVGLKLVSKINHKLSVQNDDKINLFSLKSEDDCDRLVDELSKYFINENRIDTIFVKDTSPVQKKYLYDILESSGYPKSILYRRFTTYKRT
jgi:hypothetical protein